MEVIKGSVCIHIASVKVILYGDLLFITAYKGNIHSAIKGVFLWKIKVFNKTLGMDIFYIVSVFMRVNHLTEWGKFIFTMNGLNECIRISMFSRIIKSIQMHAVKAFCGMPLTNMVFLRGEGRFAKKVKVVLEYK